MSEKIFLQSHHCAALRLAFMVVSHQRRLTDVEVAACETITHARPRRFSPTVVLTLTEMQKEATAVVLNELLTGLREAGPMHSHRELEELEQFFTTA